MPSLSDQSQSRSRDARQKNTLFCPDCSHASPTTGDWRVRTTAAGAVYSCPECGATVTTRRTARTTPSPALQNALADCSRSAWPFGMGRSVRRCALLIGLDTWPVDCRAGRRL